MVVTIPKIFKILLIELGGTILRALHAELVQLVGLGCHFSRRCYLLRGDDARERDIGTGVGAEMSRRRQ
jgi:hypothetical protein